MRFFLPIILVGSAIALFVVYTNPTYQKSKTLAVTNASYDDALNKSNQLRKLRDDLLSKRNAFNNDDVTKLAHVLPDNVDNIRLIIDINNIASKNNLALTSVQIGDLSDSRKARDPVAVGSSGDSLGSVTVGFSVVASYDAFIAFTQDLERSLRIVDIQKITFTAGQNDLNTYAFSIRTYWLH